MSGDDPMVAEVENDGDVRYVPPEDGSGRGFDHATNFSKYRWASGFVAGRRVLDTGCGSGYGIRLLADAGARVALGVDQSRLAVRYANRRHGRSRLSFAPMDICRLAIGNGRFDIVVSMDAIEHLEEYEEHVREAHRVLAPGGRFLVGTPNKRLTSVLITADNPYHVHEFVPEEFEELLTRHFSRVTLLGLEFRDPAKKRRYLRMMEQVREAERDPSVRQKQKADGQRAAAFSTRVLAHLSPMLRANPLFRRLGTAILEPLGLYRPPFVIEVDDIGPVSGPLDDCPGLLGMCVK